MKPKVPRKIFILCLSFGCCLIAECYGIEKHHEILIDSNNSSNQTLLRNTFGWNCSASIFISSDGPYSRVQGNLLGVIPFVVKVVKIVILIIVICCCCGCCVGIFFFYRKKKGRVITQSKRL